MAELTPMHKMAQEIDALQSRLALAEKVCDAFDAARHNVEGALFWTAFNALDAYLAAKENDDD